MEKNISINLVENSNAILAAIMLNTIQTAKLRYAITNQPEPETLAADLFEDLALITSVIGGSSEAQE